MILSGEYEELIRALKQKNKYRYGFLGSKNPIIVPNKKIKLINTSDGIVYLFKHDTKKEAIKDALKHSKSEYHNFIKKNLKHLNQSIHLELYTIRYDERLKRVIIQPNKRWLNDFLKLFYSITHSKSPSANLYIWKINDLLSNLKDVIRNSIITAEQRRAIQKQIRKNVVEGLTSIYKYSKKEAIREYRKKIKKLYYE